MPFGLRIITSASLTWLPPPNTNCTFNYTVNITNSSCSMTVYSSSTLLILIDLLTRGQNCSFAVAVTDSTVQLGMVCKLCINNISLFSKYKIVPGLVSIISWKLYQTIIIADWEVRHVIEHAVDNS